METLWPTFDPIFDWPLSCALIHMNHEIKVKFSKIQISSVKSTLRWTLPSAKHFITVKISIHPSNSKSLTHTCVWWDYTKRRFSVESRLEGISSKIFGCKRNHCQVSHSYIHLQIFRIYFHTILFYFVCSPTPFLSVPTPYIHIHAQICIYMSTCVPRFFAEYKKRETYQRTCIYAQVCIIIIYIILNIPVFMSLNLSPSLLTILTRSLLTILTPSLSGFLVSCCVFYSQILRFCSCVFCFNAFYCRFVHMYAFKSDVAVCCNVLQCVDLLCVSSDLIVGNHFCRRGLQMTEFGSVLKPRTLFLTIWYVWS